jgi:hypothetical protein
MLTVATLTGQRLALIASEMRLRGFSVIAAIAHPRAADRAVVVVHLPGEPADRLRLRTAQFIGPAGREGVKIGKFQTGYFSLTACLSIIAVEFRR